MNKLSRWERLTLAMFTLSYFIIPPSTGRKTPAVGEEQNQGGSCKEHGHPRDNVTNEGPRYAPMVKTFTPCLLSIILTKEGFFIPEVISG